ncbi:glycosyltransferase BC10-like [Mercurialis annua]|uniref:glycosyltransferase BC10-like n=1 Tax=Mercurialis annua TaxID=3986 RepID=UPI002160E034|nr:glycosyltransferase BC10-like [Mercurialis annua]XP_050216313.1 glycosyltransferase BC10-like [Mercurialis annua]
MQVMSGYNRQRAHPKSKKAIWIIVMAFTVALFLIGGSVYSPADSSAACFFFPSRTCKLYDKAKNTAPPRVLSDEEIVAQVVIREILKTPPIQSNSPRIAFMFLTPGSLPFERLWEQFFNGHEDRFSVYVHASKEKPVHVSRYFVGRDIPSHKVEWGKISMVEAEKRLLARALLDPNNQHFVLLSDSCVPLHSFDYVYNFLMFTNISYIDSFEDHGPDGNGRYSEHMLPEIEKEYFRKGSQWFSMKRQHAIIVMSDFLYYTKFRLFCRPNMNGRNCYADEHYLPTVFHMIDPVGIANWSVTYVDWSERKWHPRTYRTRDVTYELLKNITSTDVALHLTSDKKRVVTTGPCLWNGMQRPCYLFARKFYPEALDKLLFLFSNYTAI